MLELLYCIHIALKSQKSAILELLLLFVKYFRIQQGSIALLSHFDKVLALSKFALLKCENEVNPVARIPFPMSPAPLKLKLRSSGGPENPCYGVHFNFAL